jgi:Ala-tRNA(Pro) deacylase
MTAPLPEVDRAICETLRAWGIGFSRFDHPPVFTCAEADVHVPSAADALQTKNLFLRDKKGARHWLVITSCEKRVDIRALGEQLGAGRLSFGSPERLMKYLGVTPGAVTLLALAHPSAREVELVIDEAARGLPWRCHPMVNTATLVLEPADCAAFLFRTGHTPAYQAIPELDASAS